MRASIRRSGGSLILWAFAACYGFAGGGFPGHVRTVAVLPFENETQVAELTREVNEELRKGLRSRLGLREASEARAHAVVRGKLTRYEADAPVGYSANPGQATTATRRLQIAMDIEIVDQTTGRTLFKRAGLSADGQYAEGQEAAGRKQAIERLVTEVVEGAQSQW